TLRLHGRRLMRGLPAATGVADASTQEAALREIDKLERRGPAAVEASLFELGMSTEEAGRLMEWIAVRATGPKEIQSVLDRIGGESAPEAAEGAAELAEVVRAMGAREVPAESYALG